MIYLYPNKTKTRNKNTTLSPQIPTLDFFVGKHRSNENCHLSSLAVRVGTTAQYHEKILLKKHRKLICFMNI